MAEIARRAVVKGAAALLVACGAPKSEEIEDTNDLPPDTGSGPTTDTNPDTDPDTDTTPEVTTCAVVRDPADDAWIPLSLSDYPELATVGGAAYVELGGEPLVLARTAEDCLVAMDRICTHAGCDIAYSSGRFACPCHGSVWNEQGVLQAGPARDQKVFPATVEEDEIWIRIR